MRAEFKVWYDKETQRSTYAMHQPGVPKKHFAIDSFCIGGEKINQLMPELLSRINGNTALQTKLFQAEFLTTTLNEVLVSLIYHKPLSETWVQSATELASALSINIIGRSRKQKIVIGDDAVYECFTVNGASYRYQQVENAFTQPNAAVCEKMLNWATDAAQSLQGDLLELYCGNGNFTIPLSRQFTKVLATEISKTSVGSAQHNIALNNAENIDIARMSSEEFTQALNRDRAFRRLQHVDLDSYNFTTLFVDPPRAGLDAETEALASRFDNVLYISCNPLTLKLNLQALCQSHKITRFALFDQFPYTEHRECGVLLQRL